MFTLLDAAFNRYNNNASASDFMLLIFLSYHLRELIVEGQSYEEIIKIESARRTAAQILFCELWEMSTFQTIRQICNGSKHHKIESQLEELEGFRAGFSRVGDHLGQRYILIDGKDSRSMFNEIIIKYRAFFRGLHEK